MALDEAQLVEGLLALTEQLNSGADLTVRLTGLCRAVTELTGCYRSSIFLLAGECYELRYSCGAAPEALPRERRVHAQDPLITEAVRTRSCVVTRTAQHSQLFDPPAPAPTGVQLVIVAPLLDEEQQPLGVLTAACIEAPESFSDLTARLVLGMARLAQTVIVAERRNQQPTHLHQTQPEDTQGDAGLAKSVKLEVVASMSHELRTPLNIILGYVDLLLEHAFGTLAPEQTDALRRIDKSARELLELINTTLDLSRLEAGRMTLEARETHVPDLIHEIDVETRPLREKSRVSFVCHAPASLPPLHTDPLKLKVVLKNLVVNAFKFTDQGSVLIDVYRHNGGLEFCVADTGIGMAPELVPTIFEPFRQADSFRTRRRGGFGLGLYIVRRLLDMMGGTISVDSELGRGSIFRVWVPNQPQPGTDVRS